MGNAFLLCVSHRSVDNQQKRQFSTKISIDAESSKNVQFHTQISMHVMQNHWLLTAKLFLSVKPYIGKNEMMQFNCSELTA
jgi:hypothetical protein